MTLYSVIFSIVGIAAFIIAAIVVSKFPQVALIDTEALPKERDAKKKDEIIQDRVVRMLAAKRREIAGWIAAPWNRVRALAAAFHQRILALERQLQRKPMSPAERAERVEKLTIEAEEMSAAGEYEDAEKKFVEAINLDPLNTRAFRGVAATYAELKQYEQSKETLRFLIRRTAKRGCVHARAAELYVFASAKLPNAVGECAASPAVHVATAMDYVSLASACRASGDRDMERRAVEAALLFEPSNPKYLDLLLEVCILVGDKWRALEILERLREVNPENQKLPVFEEKIAALPEPVSEKKQKHVPG